MSNPADRALTYGSYAYIGGKTLRPTLLRAVANWLRERAPW